MKKTPAIVLEVVTANRLKGGDVVYLSSGLTWSLHLNDAAASDDAAEKERLLAAAERSVTEREVVAPYLIPVKRDAGRLTPLSQRETIRANGPTVRYGPAVPDETETLPRGKANV